MTLWHEYRQKYDDGYGYTQFTHHYNLWANKSEASGKLNHKAGEKIFIDYTGKKLCIVDRETGEETLQRPLLVFFPVANIHSLKLLRVNSVMN